MQRHALNWRRAAVILGAAAIIAAVVAPASAFAKIATRILVTSTKSSVVYVTNWSQPGTVPVAPVATARLQQKTRYGWKTLKGAIYVYRNDSSNATLTQFTFLTSYASSALRYSLATRGKYKFWFKGSRTLAPSVAYATRQDYIGDSITLSNVSITTTDGVWTNVAVDYDVTWNTQAFNSNADVFDGPLYLDFEGTFENTDKTTYSGNVDMFQDFWDPLPLQVRYRVHNSYVQPILSAGATYLDTTAFVKSADPYLVTRSSSTIRTPYPQP